MDKLDTQINNKGDEVRFASKEKYREWLNKGAELYHDNIKEKEKNRLMKNDEERLVPFSKRQQKSVLTVEMLKTLLNGKYRTQWKGVEKVKSCVDAIIYEDLLWEVKPKTIIEIGAYMGGAAIWMADVMTSYGVKSHVYSMDIDLALLHPSVKEYPSVTFIQGDSHKIEESFTPEMLKDMPHPWVIVEDAHANLMGLLEYFHKYLQSEDYLIVDDTNRLAHNRYLADFNTEYCAVGSHKYDEMAIFLNNHPDEYAVDTKFCDMFGLNACWNVNGYIKRL